MDITEFDYDLPEERIARFPLGSRDASRLLVWARGEISETVFGDISGVLPAGSLLVFNNTRVVRARLVMHKAAEGQGARIEVLCLEPAEPADYERAFATRGRCEWHCMVGNSKRWSGNARGGLGYAKSVIKCGDGITELRASRKDPDPKGAIQTIVFEWDADLTFGELLELLGRVPIPPYLGREGQEVDNTRYQTVYARVEGSVAAPTAGLHFTPELIAGLDAEIDEVTLHVGAGTFLPVKVENALDHPMHTEHFEVTLATIEHLRTRPDSVVAVGTTSVRTLESLPALAWRIRQSDGPEIGNPETDDADLGRPVGQFEPYDIPAEFDGAEALATLAEYMRTRGIEKIAASTRIMISPGFVFRVVRGIVTNFHQPRSTLLLLIAAFTGGSEWRRIYDHALKNNFRFLSYGDSSLLLR